MKLPAIPVCNTQESPVNISCLYLTSSSVVENMKRGLWDGKMHAVEFQQEDQCLSYFSKSHNEKELAKTL